MKNYMKYFNLLCCIQNSLRCKAFFDRIRHFIMLKSNISDIYSQKYTEIKINSNGDLTLEKTTTCLM